MDLSALISPDQYVKLQKSVELFNSNLSGQRQVKQVLEKDDFLKLLITQLTNQDPTQPMNDREFIAQMAQFSALEQMVNMSEGMARVANLVGRGQAYSLLGKAVTVADGTATVTGTVEEVSGGDYPQILINGKYYDIASVESVSIEQGANR
jgi:flagellar basal-body rod modification protein FlgD